MLSQPRRVHGCILLASILVYSSAVASEPADEHASMRFFESHVRPLLAEHCYECHGPDEDSGGVRLDSLAAMLLGGDSGPAIAPGDPDGSLLMEAVRYEGYEMPPSGKLPDAEIEVLRQ